MASMSIGLWMYIGGACNTISTVLKDFLICEEYQLETHERKENRKSQNQTSDKARLD